MNTDHAVVLNFHSVEQAIAPADDIVSSARAGSPAAFAELHAIYSRRLYRTIVAITKSHEDAEDALQDTFLRAYLTIHAFEGRSSVYSWLTRIAINSALMILRKRRARPEILFDPEPDALAETFTFEVKDPAPDPEQTCDLRQRRVKILRAIHNLRPHLREPIRMRVAKDASMDEIGQALNISKAAVKARLHRARVRLSAIGDLKRFAARRHDSLLAIGKREAASTAFDRFRISRTSESE
jgi:RNA polymerase sigma-70 factor, ECF subfamily